MTHYCLDFCSLLNLYCGWSGIQEFHKFGSSWSISETAFNEFKYVRTLQPDGSFLNSEVNRNSVLAQYPLSVLGVSSPKELNTLIELGKLIDDGEAASLALAKHRGFTFVTDDNPAIYAAKSLSVPTVSSIELIFDWSKVQQSHVARLPDVVRNIAILASFHPPRRSDHKQWWNGFLPP